MAHKLWAAPEMNVFENLFQQYFDHNGSNKYLYKIFIDGELQETMINDQPRIFENVNGILGHSYYPELGFPGTVGQYREFIFRSEPYQHLLDTP